MGSEIRTIRGMLRDLEVKTTKEGKPYSEGSISLEGGERVRWRIWNAESKPGFNRQCS